MHTVAHIAVQHSNPHISFDMFESSGIFGGQRGHSYLGLHTVAYSGGIPGILLVPPAFRALPVTGTSQCVHWQPYTRNLTRSHASVLARKMHSCAVSYPYTLYVHG